MAGPKADQVAVRDDTGKLVYVPKDEAQQVLQSGGYSAVSDEDLKSHIAKVEKRKAFTGALPATQAFVAGGLREASLGTSDALARGLSQLVGGKEAAQRTAAYLSDLKERQPIASGVGGAVGLVGPLLLSGGLSGAAEGGALAAGELAAPAAAEAAAGLTAKGIAKGALRAVSAPLRGINAVGKAAEHGLASALGGKAIIAPMAARGAAEGALFGAGNALSDQALSQDPELTAEHVLPDVLSGALGGLVLGGATGTVLKGAKSFLKEAKPLVNDIIDETVGKAEPGAPKSWQDKLADKLKEESNKSAFKATEPTKAQFKNVEQYHKGASVQGERIKNAFEEITGKSYATADIESLRATQEGLEKRSGKVFNEAPKELDTLPDEYKPSHNKLVGELTDYIDSVHKRTGQKPLAAELRSFVKEFTEGTELIEGEGDKTTYTNLRKLKEDIDTKAYPGGKAPVSPTEAQVAYKQMSHIVRDFFEKNADKAEKEVGDLLSPELQSGWQQAKKDYETAKILEKHVDNMEAKRGTLRRASLTDYLSTIGAIASGHPVAGLALGAANKYLREHGNQIASVLLDKASKLMTVNDAAQGVEKEIGSSIAQFLNPKEVAKSLFAAGAPQPIFAGTTGDERQKSFETYVAKLKDSVANPNQQFADISKRIGDMGNIAPQTASHIITKHLANEQFLASKLPPGLTPTDTIFPNKTKPKVSDAEMAKFSRYVAVAQRGSKVLMHELKTNRVSPETVEGMKVMYPASYAKIQSSLIDNASKMKNDMSFSQKLQLFTLFGIPTDRILNPQSRMMLQNNFQHQQNKAMSLSPAGKQRQPRQPKITAFAPQYTTSVQHTERIQ